MLTHLWNALFDHYMEDERDKMFVSIFKNFR